MNNEQIINNKVSRIYFVGIKGVGMASLAVIAKEAGISVRGSDLPETFITDKMLSENNISVDTEFDSQVLNDFIQNEITSSLVITTAAHGGFDNPQVKWAKEQEIPVLTHGQAVGEFMKGTIFDREFRGISVAGAHGKTTITAMMAASFSKLGKDPSYTVGTSEIFPIGDAGHFGSGEFFIAEADEYFSELKYDRTPKFLYQHPEFLIINNIDFDHPDVYQNVEEVREAYSKLIDNVSPDGLILINGDDDSNRSLINKKSVSQKIITYGKDPEKNDYWISHFEEVELSSKFIVKKNDSELLTLSLNIPGLHNAANSLAVIALLDHLGFNSTQIGDSLSYFKGTKRRIEYIGETQNKAKVFDDYAHHPLEILKTIEAIKKALPQKKLVIVFQPHTYSRTVSLINDFSNAFENTDHVCLLPIFTSAREIVDDSKRADIESRLKGKIPHSEFFQDADSVVKYVHTTFDSPDFVIVTMGAGDVYKVSQKLKVKSQK